MKSDQRLSLALHVLLHMSEQPDRPITSQAMAACAGTNPVVIRRTFAGLRDAGIVTSVKGHGGGWQLARAPAEVNVAEIQNAIGARVVSLASARDLPRCLVLRAVVHSLDDAMLEAERVFDRRLASLSLADLAGDVSRLHAARNLNLGESHAV